MDAIPASKMRTGDLLLATGFVLLQNRHLSQHGDGMQILGMTVTDSRQRFVKRTDDWHSGVQEDTFIAD